MKEYNGIKTYNGLYIKDVYIPSGYVSNYKNIPIERRGYIKKGELSTKIRELLRRFLYPEVLVPCGPVDWHSWVYGSGRKPVREPKRKNPYTKAGLKIKHA